MDLPLGILRIDVQHLPPLERLPDRNHHPPARLDLLEQLRRGILRGAGDDDDVEPVPHLRPAVIPVAHPRMHVVIPQRREDPPHRLAQRFDDLDRVGLRHDPRQQSALEPAAGADFQRRFARLRLADLGHVGLPQIVRQRRAPTQPPGLRVRLVGVARGRPVLGVDIVEIFARHRLERRHHRRVGTAQMALQVRFDQVHRSRLAGLDGVELRIGQADRPAGRVHRRLVGLPGPAGRRPGRTPRTQRHRRRQQAAPRHPIDQSCHAQESPIPMKPAERWHR